MSEPSWSLANRKTLTACHRSEDVRDCIEEKELRGSRGLDEHEYAGRDDSHEANDVHDPDAVQDDVSWAGERFGREGHLAAGGSGLLVRVGGGRQEDVAQVGEGRGLDW